MSYRFLAPSSITQTNSPRVLRVSPSKVDYTFGKIALSTVDESIKYAQLPRELSKKQSQSGKNISFNKVSKADVENHESWDASEQRQIGKLKNYYETQIKNITISHRRTQLELQARCKGLEKQRNDWKDVALKLKTEMETKVADLLSKQANHQKPKVSSTYEQENSSLRANGAMEAEIARQKAINAQIVQQLSKIKEQNRLLKDQILSLRTLLAQKSNPPSSPSRKNSIQIQKRHESPIRSRHHSESFQSPAKKGDGFHRSHRHQSHHSHSKEGDNDYSHNETQKELDKLRKVCKKMEKIIAERNQDIIKEKTRQLNMKYMRQ